MLIKRISPLTKKHSSREINITKEQLEEIESRTRNIQDIVPHLSPGEREFILTGYTEQDWKDMFLEDPDDGMT
jgi:hypothetical protein